MRPVSTSAAGPRPPFERTRRRRSPAGPRRIPVAPRSETRTCPGIAGGPEKGSLPPTSPNGVAEGRCSGFWIVDPGHRADASSTNYRRRWKCPRDFWSSDAFGDVFAAGPRSTDHRRRPTRRESWLRHADAESGPPRSVRKADEGLRGRSSSSASSRLLRRRPHRPSRRSASRGSRRDRTRGRLRPPRIFSIARRNEPSPDRCATWAWGHRPAPTGSSAIRARTSSSYQIADVERRPRVMGGAAKLCSRHAASEDARSEVPGGGTGRVEVNGKPSGTARVERLAVRHAADAARAARSGPGRTNAVDPAASLKWLARRGPTQGGRNGVSALAPGPHTRPAKTGG